MYLMHNNMTLLVKNHFLDTLTFEDLTVLEADLTG